MHRMDGIQRCCNESLEWIFRMNFRYPGKEFGYDSKAVNFRTEFIIRIPYQAIVRKTATQNRKLQNVG